MATLAPRGANFFVFNKLPCLFVEDFGKLLSVSDSQVLFRYTKHAEVVVAKVAEKKDANLSTQNRQVVQFRLQVATLGPRQIYKTATVGNKRELSVTSHPCCVYAPLFMLHLRAEPTRSCLLRKPAHALSATQIAHVLPEAEVPQLPRARLTGNAIQNTIMTLP